MVIRIWFYTEKETNLELKCRSFRLMDGFLLVSGAGWVKAFNLKNVQYFEYEKASEGGEN